MENRALKMGIPYELRVTDSSTSLIELEMDTILPGPVLRTNLNTDSVINVADTLVSRS